MLATAHAMTITETGQAVRDGLEGYSADAEKKNFSQASASQQG